MAVVRYQFKRANFVQFNARGTSKYYEFIQTNNIIGKTDDSKIRPLYAFSIEFEICNNETFPDPIPIFGSKLGLSCWYMDAKVWLYENGDWHDGTPLYSSTEIWHNKRIRLSLQAYRIGDDGYMSYYVHMSSVDDLYPSTLTALRTEFRDIIYLNYPIQSNSSNLYYNFIGAVNGVDTQAEGLRIYGFKTSFVEPHAIVDHYYIPGYCTEGTEFISFADKAGVYYNRDLESCVVNGSNVYKIYAYNTISPYYTISTNSTHTSIDYHIDLESATSLTIKEGSVAKVQDKDGKVLWDKAKHKYGNNAYGIRWKNTDVKNVERVGNMELHKTLPIQTKFKTCCYDHTNNCFLYANPKDRRFLLDNNYEDDESEFVFVLGINYKIVGVDSCDLKFYIPFGKPEAYIHCPNLTDDITGKLIYNYVNIYIRGFGHVTAFVQGIDIENKKIFIKSHELTPQAIEEFKDAPYDDSNILKIELGFPINGYYGSVMVDTGGSFYLWSETDDEYNYVWISEEKPKNVEAQYIPRMLVSADTVAIKSGEIKAGDENNIPNDFWGYLGILDDGASICCRNFCPELRGGDGSKNEDFMLQPIDSTSANAKPMDYWQALSRQGKPAGNTICSTFLDANDLNNMKNLSYVTYKAIFWLYTIEYASFDVTQDYKSSMNNLRRGGLGEDVVTHLQNKTGKDWIAFNNKNPINMCLSSFDIKYEECCDEYGRDYGYRNYGIADTTDTKYTSPKAYRGIEWLFADRGIFLADINFPNGKVLYTDFEGNTINVSAYSVNDVNTGYIKSFLLSNKAELFPSPDLSTNTNNSIAYNYQNDTNGYLIIGYKNNNDNEAYKKIYRCSTCSDETTAPILGSVQQIIIE